MIPLLLRRRGSLSEILAITAFAASSGVLVTVLGGVLAFAGRMGGPLMSAAGESTPDQNLAGFLLVCALIAGALLLPSALSLGASAARLSLARREQDLAAVRLVGGTRTQVGGIAVADVAVQAGIGAAVGVGLHVLAVPLLTALDFSMRPFTIGELTLPLWVYPLLVAGYVLLAAGSGALALLGVAISPLGVARRSRTVRISLLRGVAWVGLLIAFVVVSRLSWRDDGTVMAVMVVMMMLVVAAVDLIGPLVVWLLARIVAACAPSASWLVGARRLAADPKAGWRSVSAICFGLVVAGFLTLQQVVTNPDSDPETLALSTALATGGYLTLGIAALVAAVGTGVTQAARVIDQEDSYRAQHIGGAQIAQLHRARLTEITIPLGLGVVIAALSALILLSPVMSGVSAHAVAATLQYVLSAAAALGLVMVAMLSSAPLVGRAARARA